MVPGSSPRGDSKKCFSNLRGEFPETLCIEQTVVLFCRFAGSKVRWTSRVLWMAVVSQSSVKSSQRNSASSTVGANPFLKNHRRSRNHYFELFLFATFPSN